RDVVLVMAGLAAVLGHVFPVYLRFKGGKGAATGLGVMVMLLPLPTLVALVVFLVVAVIWRFVSLASMAGVLALLAAVIVKKYLLVHSVADIYFIMTLALALLMIVTHRQNIARLLHGAEHRFTFSSRSGEAGTHG
ncbi:MAG: glycerol-3-phosphate acyltransferase, partial [candidate division Zixibacteria bacterium]|nr:glycerol-3-phosphate acyltransferase [candidate division Zixibacteria bacterium]